MPKASVKYVDQRFKDVIRWIDQRFTDVGEGTRTALEAVDTANAKSIASTEKRWDSSNEWRGAMNDRERQFLTRKEMYLIIGTATAVVTLISGFIVAVVGVILTYLSFVRKAG